MPFAAAGKVSPFKLKPSATDNRIKAEPLHTRLINIDRTRVACRIV